jgi:hypothetical protein
MSEAATLMGSGTYHLTKKTRANSAGSSAAPAARPTLNRRVIAVMRQRLTAGEQMARMYQEPGLAWRKRQAELAEELIAQRQAMGQAD